MKKYKVLSPIISTKIDGKERVLKQGDEFEAPDTDIVVRALLKRNQIKEADLKEKTLTPRGLNN